MAMAVAMASVVPMAVAVAMAIVGAMAVAVRVSAPCVRREDFVDELDGLSELEAEASSMVPPLR